ncbi:diacylglycerol/lipid kinase family protein [Alkaliphilus transvaalensis]|uniref:diacylglycerol/lipid kinase family protein n=1 Tax=Alkaliphilus transvaalensis TaxID=114628 RepID=UPI000688FE56|nr:diacylglycerol kinase family protein [Alkaliphilus transvaalensis]
MKGRSYLFVINPVAGNHKIKKYIKEIENKLIDSGISYKLEYTSRKGSVAEILNKVDEKPQEIVVAVGGDGTVNEVINCLVGSDKTLGIIPCGTGNDLAKSLNIPLNPLDALDLLLAEEAVSVDLGNVSGNYFSNVASIGLDAEIAHCANMMKHKISGTKAYILALLKVLFSFKSFSIEALINGNYICKDVMLVAICNGKYYGGGMKIAPDANILDGLLDVCIIEKMPKYKLLFLFPSVYKGYHNQFKEVKYFRTDRVRIKSNQKFINVDGEIVETKDNDVDFYINCIKLKVIMKAIEERSTIEELAY